MKIKETSWLFVLLTPSRWGEALRYVFAPYVAMGAADRPDPRDLDAKIPLGALTVTLPEKFSIREKAIALGWGPTKQSHNSCTAYSKCGSVERINTMEHAQPVSINAEIQWAHQEETGATRENGDFIQNAEYQFHRNPQGFPQTKYRRMRRNENTVYGTKRWLVGKQEEVRTGIYWKWCAEEHKMNMKVMQDTGYFTPGQGTILGGHAVTITGWDDSRAAFEIVESELMQWGDNPPGVFWVRYEDFDRMFSKYISQDSIDLI